MQTEFMTSAGFKLDSTIGVGTWNVWRGHDLTVTIMADATNPYVFMAEIIQAQKVKMFTDNRAHLAAIVGPSAKL